MSKPITIVVFGDKEMRPLFVRFARAHWIAMVSEGGSLYGRGRTRKDAAAALQVKVDLLRHRVASYGRSLDW